MTEPGTSCVGRGVGAFAVLCALLAGVLPANSSATGEGHSGSPQRPGETWKATM